MTDLYVMALINGLICLAIQAVCVCRLNALHGRALLRVRAEYASIGAGAFVSMVQPWFGEWPRYASITIASCFLLALVFSSTAWRNDRAPKIVTDPRPEQV